MSSGSIPPKEAPRPEEVLEALQAAISNNPRLADMPVEEIARQLNLEARLERGTEHQLGSTTSSGMLEAVRADGFVLSVEDRAVYIPREAVLQIELYDSNRSDTSIDF
jgi:hypothetical protein